jgi:hypothetical protein
MARSNDPKTWASFQEIRAAYRPGRDAGIGFVFSTEDPFVGIDLDGIRQNDGERAADWARAIILRLNSYAETSPSKTGIKIFCTGKLPFANGRKIIVPGAPKVCAKEPGIEMYDHGRYFAVTGWQVMGPDEPQDRQAVIDWLREKYWPAETPVRHEIHGNAAVMERARKYLAKLPPAISGSGGHNATFYAACVLVLGFDLAEIDALELLREFNQRCDPPWSKHELVHKVMDAMKQGGERGHLKNTMAPSIGYLEGKVDRLERHVRRLESRLQ